ncbi:hypothetical protein OMAG_001687 [Candidatus Omnitrophus magneticus]|uniref:Transposase n=1 Tax=Candidatus Omnitrophus magneticus TaxID=1609969 RepID=A0A0F0CSL9_9BACT|nr:hypothetical protein OMAG_001687 [Candidatus Omnitrophus magneticus]
MSIQAFPTLFALPQNPALPKFFVEYFHVSESTVFDAWVSYTL